MTAAPAAPAHARAADSIAATIRVRLSYRKTIYLAHPDRQAVAQSMARAGEVTCAWGEGEDRGLLLVRKARRWGAPSSGPAGGGGDAA